MTGVVVLAREAQLGQWLVDHLTAALGAAAVLAKRVPDDAAVAVVVVDGDEALTAANHADAAGVAVVALAAPAQATGRLRALPLPVRPDALVDAVRRAQARVPDGPAVGPFSFDRSGRRLVDGATGEVVRLTEIEARVLGCLMSAGDQAVSRDALLVDVWGYGPGVTTNTVATHMYRLRRKLERPGYDNPLFSGPEGYRLSR